MGRRLDRGGRGPPAPALALALAPALALALVAPASALTPAEMFNGVPAVLDRLRQEAEVGTPLFSVEKQTNSWLCKAHGFHDGTNRENTFVAPRCLKDGQDMDVFNMPGFRFDSSIYTPEELKEAGENTDANKEACERLGGEYHTLGSICAAAYLDEEEFSFEKFVNFAAGDSKEQARRIVNAFAPACCGSKPLEKWPVCEVWSGAEGDGVDRSRNVVSLECLIGPEGDTTDIKGNLTDFQSDPRVVSREELLDPRNLGVCQSRGDGARVAISTCGNAMSQTEGVPEAYLAGAMPHIVSAVGDLCCPGEKQSEEKAAAILEEMREGQSGPKHEAESWLCQKYGYHDGKDRSSPDAESPVISVKCRDSRLEDPEPVDCEKVKGMVCNTGVFGADRLGGVANKQACAQHFDGAGVLELETCSKMGVYNWYEDMFSQQGDEAKAYVLGVYGPQCCGYKPKDSDLSKMCDASPMTGPPDGEDRSMNVVNVECVRKKPDGEKDESFTENVPGFKYLRLGSPVESIYSMEEVLSQENLDACLAGGGTGFEVATCSLYAYYASMTGVDSEAGMYYLSLLAPKCCTLSEEEKKRPKSGPEMEKNSWVCQKYGHHDGSDHTGRAMGVSCKNSDDEEYDSEKIKGFKDNTLVYTAEELKTATNRAACETHAEGARFEMSTCDSIFRVPASYFENELALQGEEGINYTINTLGPLCCGLKPPSESYLCKGVEGQPPPGTAQRLVTVGCERKTDDGDEEKLEAVTGFKSLDLFADSIAGTTSEYSREELLSDENAKACYAAGGDKVTVANCATMQMYSAMYAGTEAEASFAPYLPVVRGVCCGGPPAAVPGIPTNTGCRVLGSAIHIANQLRSLGAPKVRTGGQLSPYAKIVEAGECPAT